MKPYLYRADHPAAVCRKKPTACRPPNGCLQEKPTARRPPSSCLQEEADGMQTTQRLSAGRSRQRADHPAAVLNETNEICANHVYIYFTKQTKAITLSINHLQNQNRSLTPVLKFVFQKVTNTYSLEAQNLEMRWQGSIFESVIEREPLIQQTKPPFDTANKAPFDTANQRERPYY